VLPQLYPGKCPISLNVYVSLPDKCSCLICLKTFLEITIEASKERSLHTPPPPLSHLRRQLDPPSRHHEHAPPAMMHRLRNFLRRINPSLHHLQYKNVVLIRHARIDHLAFQIRITFRNQRRPHPRSSRRRQPKFLELIHLPPRTIPATHHLLRQLHRRNIDHARHRRRLEIHHHVPRHRHHVRFAIPRRRHQHHRPRLQQLINLPQCQRFFLHPHKPPRRFHPALLQSTPRHLPTPRNSPPNN